MNQRFAVRRDEDLAAVVLVRAAQDEIGRHHAVHELAELRGQQHGVLGDEVHRAAAPLDEQREDAPLVDPGPPRPQRLLQPEDDGAFRHGEHANGIVVDRRSPNGL